ncbi:hypothetical protein P3406_24225, partial [Vibrio parahaemolyticus]|nr:hypothetical protein [Vibrio parahaemolyticus]
MKQEKMKDFVIFHGFTFKKKPLIKPSLNPNENSFKERAKRVRLYIKEVKKSKYNHIELEMKIVRKWNLSLNKTEIIS